MSLRIGSTADTLGYRLRTLRKEMEATVEKTSSSDSPNDLRTNGYMMAILAIENMQIAYFTSLLTPVARVDGSITYCLTSLWHVVDDLKQKESTFLTFSIEKRMQELIHSLPLKGQHQLTRISTRSLAPTTEKDAYQVLLKCEGTFQLTQQQHPSMKFADGSISYPVVETADSLQFHHTVKIQAIQKASWIPVTLRLPTIKGWTWSVLEAQYRIWVKIPPLKIGELKAHFISSIKTKDEKRECQSEIFTVRGNPEHPCQWMESTYDIKAHLDWMIIPDSVKPCVHEGTMGTYKITLVRLRGDRVKLTVGVAAKEANSPALLNFSVKYTEQKGRIRETKTSEIIDAFKWGEVKWIEMSQSEKKLVKVVLKTEDGPEYTFLPGVSSTESGLGFLTTGQAAHPFVTMKLNDNKLVMRADPD